MFLLNINSLKKKQLFTVVFDSLSSHGFNELKSIFLFPLGVSPGGSLVSPSPAKTIPPAPVAPQVASPLASILSKMDMTPEELFSALSESQGQASGLQGEKLCGRANFKERLSSSFSSLRKTRFHSWWCGSM